MKAMRTAVIILMMLVGSSYAESIDFVQELTIRFLEQQMNGFSSLEHQSLGEQIDLRFYNNNPEKKIHLPNGLTVSYSQIVMLAGDFFGDPQYPISNCPEHERKTCFNRQFEALAGEQNKNNCEKPRTQAEHLINYFKEVEQLLADWRSQGKTDAEFYTKHNSTFNKKINRMTCGGSLISDYLPFGNYLKLTAANFDHFQPDSLIAYAAGHQVALDTALLAHQQKMAGNVILAEQLLELAYAQNAFANHFLSDSFASGHIRTPRREIENHVKLPGILNLLLANLMHDEDNKMGLNVVNAEGNYWVIYGDNYLFEKEAELQRTILLQAMQRSADSIYEVFDSGIVPEYFSELKLVPLFDKVEQVNQTAPLFKMDHGILFKRIKNHDPYNYEWTDNWSGLNTLLNFEG